MTRFQVLSAFVAAFLQAHAAVASSIVELDYSTGPVLSRTGSTSWTAGDFNDDGVVSGGARKPSGGQEPLTKAK